MAQLSRPYQIALAALVVLAAAWLLVLRPHSSSSNGTEASTATVAQPSTSSTSSSASSPVYHGSAPGIEGLTRAIAKAHGAVVTSEQNAKQLSERAAQASSTASGASASTSSTPSSTHPTSTGATTTKAPASTPSSTTKAAHPVHEQPGIKSQSGAGRTPARQALVERALHEGKVAVILFWNRQGSDDRAVRFELSLLEAVHHIIRPVAHTPQVRRRLERAGLELQKPFAAFEASAKQVASFGTITRGVQVYDTPTILVVGKNGYTQVITGLTDAYAIEQAIDEVRNS